MNETYGRESKHLFFHEVQLSMYTHSASSQAKSQLVEKVIDFIAVRWILIRFSICEAKKLISISFYGNPFHSVKLDHDWLTEANLHEIADLFQ